MYCHGKKDGPNQASPAAVPALKLNNGILHAADHTHEGPFPQARRLAGSPAGLFANLV